MAKKTNKPEKSTSTSTTPPPNKHLSESEIDVYVKRDPTSLTPEELDLMIHVIMYDARGDTEYVVAANAAAKQFTPAQIDLIIDKHKSPFLKLALLYGQRDPITGVPSMTTDQYVRLIKNHEQEPAVVYPARLCLQARQMQTTLDVLAASKKAHIQEQEAAAEKKED